jgi:hypothetical protein
MNLGRSRTVWTPANEDAVTAAVELKPGRSSRDYASKVGLCQQRVLEILHDYQLNPYKYFRSAYLFPDVRPLCM